jgi:hypothetical protein
VAFNFAASNFPDFFIRHRNFIGELTRMEENLLDDFGFNLKKVRIGSNLVAFRSVNFPRLSLRHSNFLIRLKGPSGPSDHLFEQDSSFFEEPGLASPSGFSYRSFNFPDRYLRHRNFTLFVEPKDSPNLAPDATFFKQGSAVIIDPGTVLIPADG